MIWRLTAMHFRGPIEIRVTRYAPNTTARGTRWHRHIVIFLQNIVRTRLSCGYRTSWFAFPTSSCLIAIPGAFTRSVVLEIISGLCLSFMTLLCGPSPPLAYVVGLVAMAEAAASLYAAQVVATAALLPWSACRTLPKVIVEA